MCFFYQFILKDPYDYINKDDRAEVKKINVEVEDRTKRLAKVQSDMNDAGRLIGENFS